jgi:hypothetical protein
VPLLRELASNEGEQRIFDFLWNAAVMVRRLVTNVAAEP